MTTVILDRIPECSRMRLYMPGCCFWRVLKNYQASTNKRRIKSQWLLHNLASDGAVLVSFLFWTIAYDGSGLTLVNCTTRGINAVFVLMDMLISRTPIRMLHLYQCSCFGLVYMTFSYIYHLCGGTNHKGEPYIYKPLDNSNLQVAVSTALVSIFLVGPHIHCWIFFLYRFRLFIHRYLRAMERRVDPDC